MDLGKINRKSSNEVKPWVVHLFFVLFSGGFLLLALLQQPRLVGACFAIAGVMLIFYRRYFAEKNYENNVIWLRPFGVNTGARLVKFCESLYLLIGILFILGGAQQMLGLLR